MDFLDFIVTRLNQVSSFFYDMYLETYSWAWPFHHISTPLYRVHELFNGLAWDFSNFNIWVSDTVTKLRAILSWDTIWSYILSIIPNIQSLNTWWTNWTGNVWNVVTNWWASTQTLVQGWINDAKQYLQTQVNSLNVWVTNLEADVNELLSQVPSINEILAWFGNWWANILAKIQGWWNERLIDVNALIDSTLRDWFPFYDELAELWSDIKLFFTDPQQWLYNGLDEFFERFW